MFHMLFCLCTWMGHVYSQDWFINLRLRKDVKSQVSRLGTSEIIETKLGAQVQWKSLQDLVLMLLYWDRWAEWSFTVGDHARLMMQSEIMANPNVISIERVCICLALCMGIRKFSQTCWCVCGSRVSAHIHSIAYMYINVAVDVGDYFLLT